MDKNRIRGVDDGGERPRDREAPATINVDHVDPAVVRRNASFLLGEISPHA